MLARDGIIFLKNELFSRRARVLLGHVEEARSRGRQQLNLLSNRLCHGSRLEEKCAEMLRRRSGQHTRELAAVKVVRVLECTR